MTVYKIEVEAKPGQYRKISIQANSKKGALDLFDEVVKRIEKDEIK